MSPTAALRRYRFGLERDSTAMIAFTSAGSTRCNFACRSIRGWKRSTLPMILTRCVAGRLSKSARRLPSRRGSRHPAHRCWSHPEEQVGSARRAGWWRCEPYLFRPHSPRRRHARARRGPPANAVSNCAMRTLSRRDSHFSTPSGRDSEPGSRAHWTKRRHHYSSTVVPQPSSRWRDAHHGRVRQDLLAVCAKSHIQVAASGQVRRLGHAHRRGRCPIASLATSGR